MDGDQLDDADDQRELEEVSELKVEERRGGGPNLLQIGLTDLPKSWGATGHGPSTAPLRLPPTPTVLDMKFRFFFLMVM